MILENLVERLKKNLMKKKLNNILISIFKKHGMSLFHAKICSAALINAELVGAHSHGLSRLKMYCDRIKKKLINPKPKIKIKNISQSVAHIDANNSIGFVAADIGIKKAINNAKRTGME
jgi:Malate/L-lactate dehydrogenases